MFTVNTMQYNIMHVILLHIVPCYILYVYSLYIYIYVFCKLSQFTKIRESHGNTVWDICKPTVLVWNPVWQGFEQIVLNHVTAAIHMAHFGKNLDGKLVDFRSVGQNKVCAEDNRSQKETNAGT